MPLFVDDREPEDIIRLLRRQNIDVQVHHNESGDYVFGDVAIERKTIEDLMGSVCGPNRRLWDQLKVMKDTYLQPILLIEGTIDFRDRLVNGIICTVLLFWKYQVVFSQPEYNRLPHQAFLWSTDELNRLSREATAYWVGNLFLKYGIGKSGRIPPAAVKKQQTPKACLMEMLQCVVKVGPKTAVYIMNEFTQEEFGSVDIFEFDERLKKVKGLPKKSRELLTQVFRGGIVDEV